MQQVIIDTDILSEILKGIDVNVGVHRHAYVTHFSKLTFTAFSAFEIRSGLRKRDARAQLQRAEELFAKNIEILPDGADFILAEDIVGDLLKAGHTIGIIDPFIAACAIRRGLAVATGNTRHFSYIQSAGYKLKLENWREL